MSDSFGAAPIWAFEEHEHQELRRGINHLHDVACGVGRRATPDLSFDVLGVLRWFEGNLAPHIAWEEAWLYPEIDARLGTPWATRASRFDHRQLREMVDRLAADQVKLVKSNTGDLAAEVRCHLFGLEALLRAHIEREERFLIPLLEDQRIAISSDGGIVTASISPTQAGDPV